jgi:WD40 repeat protein
MDRRAGVAVAALAAFAALAALAALAACGGPAPSAGTGRPLAAGQRPTAPASGLRIQRALSRGALSYAVAYTAGGALVSVELGTAFEVVVRDAARREQRRFAVGSAEYDVVDVAVDAAGATAWIASLDGRVRAIDLATGDTATEWPLGAPATAVALSPDEAYVATGDDTGVVCLRRAADGALLQCASVHAGAVGGLDFAAGALASAAHTGDAIVWEIPSMKILVRRERRGSANAVAFDPKGERVAIGWSLAPSLRSPAAVARERERGFGAPDPFATVEILDLGGAATVECTGHAAAVTGVAWTPDGARVVSSSWDRTLRLWDAATGRSLARLRGFEHLVRDVAAAPDGRTVAAAGWAVTLDGRATVVVDLLY